MSSAYYPLPVVIEKDGANEKAYDLYSRLLKDRIIFVGTPITDQIANAIIAQLLFLESNDPTKDIYMYINSPGGMVTAGLGIYDTMRYVKPEITTVCIGQAASMGCFLLAAGSKGKRFALPHASIMMHHVQGGQEGSAPDVTIRYEEMMRKNDLLLELLASNTGQPLEKVRVEFQRDKYMTPTQAKEFGIIDDVHEFSTRETDG
jgi:ATP-dependent Clp protease, protease subunit